jgi:selenocysteine-specific translation elongation factor
MSNLNVAVLGSPGYSRELGKKGTESDVTLYNAKRGDATLTLIEASKYPEKLASLFYAASFADYAILVVDQINAAFGETIVMLDCLGVQRGVIVPRNYIAADQLKRFTRGTVTEKYTVMEDDLPRLREHMMAKAERTPTGPTSGTGTVVVDHYFNVRGVGAVALGVVRAGQIHHHDKLLALPTSKTALIRSIQKNDEDYETAELGDRVGLALKNVEASDLERGQMLTSDPAVTQTSAIAGELRQVKYWANPLTSGMPVHVGNGLQFNSAKVTEAGNGHISIALDRPLAYAPGDRATVMYLNGGNLRVVGTIRLP